MPRKPTKGYFVKGQFVAEGSDLDLQRRRETGADQPSKTDLKRESAELQKLGEDLLDLRTDLMQQLLALGHLPDLLHEAVLSAKKITDFEGKRRQMQYVGKLMRKLDSTQVEAMRDALSVQHNGSAEETQLLHLAEAWRERLLKDDSAMEEWQNTYPGTDSQQLRALLRQARKDGLPDKAAVSQGLAPRQSRSYRELFKLVRSILTHGQSDETPEEPEDE